MAKESLLNTAITHWRIRDERYSLIGEICPHCQSKIFPPKAVCPFCGGISPETAEKASSKSYTHPSFSVKVPVSVEP